MQIKMQMWYNVSDGTAPKLFSQLGLFLEKKWPFIQI